MSGVRRLELPGELAPLARHFLKQLEREALEVAESMPLRPEHPDDLVILVGPAETLPARDTSTSQQG